MLPYEINQIQVGQVVFLQEEKSETSGVGKWVKRDFLDDEIFWPFFYSTAGTGEVIG
jgi:hypothetical protein